MHIYIYMKTKWLHIPDSNWSIRIFQRLITHHYMWLCIKRLIFVITLSVFFSLNERLAAHYPVDTYLSIQSPHSYLPILQWTVHISFNVLFPYFISLNLIIAYMLCCWRSLGFKSFKTTSSYCAYDNRAYESTLSTLRQETETTISVVGKGWNHLFCSLWLFSFCTLNAG